MVVSWGYTWNMGKNIRPSLGRHSLNSPQININSIEAEINLQFACPFKSLYMIVYIYIIIDITYDILHIWESLIVHDPIWPRCVNNDHSTTISHSSTSKPWTWTWDAASMAGSNFPNVFMFSSPPLKRPPWKPLFQCHVNPLASTDEI